LYEPPGSFASWRGPLPQPAISTVARIAMAGLDLIRARMYLIGSESTRNGHIERQLRRRRAFAGCVADRVGFTAATWGD
jgi:hypothetical protein